MAVNQPEQHWQKLDKIHKNNIQTYQIIGGLLLVIFGVLIGRELFGENGIYNGDYSTNLYTELIGIAVTVFILDALARRREVRRLQQQMITDAASMSNEKAKDAIYQLRRRNWLEGENGLLKGAELQGANLAGANLRNANLAGANLRNADLGDAILQYANLGNANLMSANLANANLRFTNLGEANLLSANLAGAQLVSAKLVGAELQGANLREANLVETNLTGVDLRFANLADVNLRFTNLGKANLLSANLAGADLTNANFDESVELPDGYNLTPDTDIERFTDSRHPNFWRSNDPVSPAYRGEDN